MNLHKTKWYLIYDVKDVFIDVGGVYSLLVVANTDILNIPVDVSQTPHQLGQPTVLITGEGNEWCFVPYTGISLNRYKYMIVDLFWRNGIQYWILQR